MPIAVCRTSDLSEAGAFWTQDVVGTPLLVTRDTHGGIHAFVNHCRHRGVRLVNEKHGVTKTFTCLLHGWTYGTDGQMGGFPLARLAQANPMLATIRENNALTPRAFELRHGFVWVAPRPRETTDVAAYLGAADAELAARGVESFVVRARGEEPLATDDLRTTVHAVVAAEDRVHALSDDAILVFHPQDVSLFSVARRPSEIEFGMEIAATATVEHMLLAAPAQRR